MERFLIITNTTKDPGNCFTQKLRYYIMQRGKECIQIASGEDVHMERMSDKPDPEKDCLLVIGGDGSVLRAAHQVLGSGVPIVGINLGTLGYLAEVERSNWREKIDLLLAGDYTIERRMMLEGNLIERDKKSVSGTPVHHALNEIVIARSGAMRMLNFNVYVDGLLLNNFDADGMIISTPTGSTGYNLSAGGPLVEPKAELTVLTPICAHTLNQRSVVLSAADTIVIEMVRTPRNESIKAEAVFDGAIGISLSYGDKIEIRRSSEVTNLVKLTPRSFLRVLHKKLSS